MTQAAETLQSIHVCGRYCLCTRTEDLVITFNVVRSVASLHIEPRFNIAPSQEAPVIISEASAPKLLRMSWGFVATNSAYVNRQPLINARAEGVSIKNSFQSSFLHYRCLVPASGFFEWATQGSRRQPYFIRHNNNLTMAFAGVYRPESRSGRQGASFVIITAPANNDIKVLHDRMPVILSQSDWGLWISPKTPKAILNSLLSTPTQPTSHYPVSPLVNNPRNDSPKLVEPYDPHLSAEQHELFNSEVLDNEAEDNLL